MDNQMFFSQSEQIADYTGKMDVCGKTADVTKLQDELTGALIGLARAMDTIPEMPAETWQIIIEGLFSNTSFHEETLRELIDRVHAEKFKLVPDCAVCSSPCGRTSDYNMENIWNEQENIRSLKLLILFGVRSMAAYAHHAMVFGHTDDEVNRFFAKALFAIGEDWDTEDLLPIAMEIGEKTLKCRELLDKADAFNNCNI